MSKRLVLHIGAEKTATTYIQNFFSVNREVFRKHGVLYPKTSFGEHAQFSLIAALHQIDHNIPLEFAPKGRDYTIESEWLPLIDALNAQDSYHTVLLSAEHFSSRLRDKGLQKLSELLSNLEGYTLEIVYYFRRQDAFFQSWYSTHIKAGGTKTVCEALNENIGNKWFFDNGFLVAKWSEYFPSAKITVRPYDYVVAKSDIITDFFSVMDLNIPEDICIPELDRNESWSASMLAFAKVINTNYAEMIGNNRYKFLDSINKSKLLDEGHRNLISIEDRDKILLAFESTNRMLCESNSFDYELIFMKSSNWHYSSPDNIAFSPEDVLGIVLAFIGKVL